MTDLQLVELRVMMKRLVEAHLALVELVLPMTGAQIQGPRERVVETSNKLREVQALLSLRTESR